MGLTLGLVLTTAALAGEPGQHRMVIYNGTTRTVHYFVDGASPSELATLRDLERAENEAAVSDQLLALRREYVSNERFLENRRQNVQQLLYGYSTDFTTGYYGGAGYGFGYPYYGGYAVAPGGGASTSLSLAYGVGDEGALKTAMSRTLAEQATPEHTARANRDLNVALARTGESSGPVRAAVGVADKGGIRPATYREEDDGFHLPKKGSAVTLTTKQGEKVEGTVVSESGSWVTLDTKAGTRMLAKSNVIDVLVPKESK
jgi:hypothetical protein